MTELSAGGRRSSMASRTSLNSRRVTWGDNTNLDLIKGVSENRFIGAFEGPELDHIKQSEHLVVVETKKMPFLLRFKVVMFGVALGLSGQALMWKALSISEVMMQYNSSYEEHLNRVDAPTVLNEIYWFIGIVTLLLCATFYIMKIIKWRGGVYREFFHPVRVNFFFAPFISSMLLLLAIPKQWAPNGSHGSGTAMKVMFFVTMMPYFLLDLYLYGAWMYSRKRSLQSGNPTYLLAVIGNFIGANLAASVDLEDVALAFFSVGCVYFLLVFISIYQAISRDLLHHLTIPNMTYNEFLEGVDNHYEDEIAREENEQKHSSDNQDCISNKSDESHSHVSDWHAPDSHGNDSEYHHGHGDHQSDHGHCEHLEHQNHQGHGDQGHSHGDHGHSHGDHGHHHRHHDRISHHHGCGDHHGHNHGHGDHHNHSYRHSDHHSIYHHGHSDHHGHHRHGHHSHHHGHMDHHSHHGHHCRHGHGEDHGYCDHCHHHGYHSHHHACHRGYQGYRRSSRHYQSSHHTRNLCHRCDESECSYTDGKLMDSSDEIHDPPSLSHHCGLRYKRRYKRKCRRCTSKSNNHYSGCDKIQKWHNDVKDSTTGDDTPKQGVTGETTPLPQTVTHGGEDKPQVITKEQNTDDDFDLVPAYAGSRVDLCLRDNEVFGEEPDLSENVLCHTQTDKQLLTRSLDETALSQTLSVITDRTKTDQSHGQSSDLIDPSFKGISGIEANVKHSSLGVVKSDSVNECKVCLESLCLQDSEHDPSCLEAMTPWYPPLKHSKQIQYSQTIHEIESEPKSRTLEDCRICDVPKTRMRPQSLIHSSTPTKPLPKSVAPLLTSSFPVWDIFEQPGSPTQHVKSPTRKMQKSGFFIQQPGQQGSVQPESPVWSSKSTRHGSPTQMLMLVTQQAPPAVSNWQQSPLRSLSGKRVKPNLTVKSLRNETEQAKRTKLGRSALQNGAVKLIIPASPSVSQKRSVSTKNKSQSPKDPPLKREQTTSIISDSSIRFIQKDNNIKEKKQNRASEIMEGKANDLKPANSALLLYPDNRPADHEHHSRKFPNLPPSMHPVLFLFLAPPSAAAIAWFEMHNRVFGLLAKALFFISLFIFLSIIRHLRLFVKDTPFSLSYWAYTFPIAALATASILYASSHTKPMIAPYMAWVLVSVASGLILVVAAITIYQTVAGDGVFPYDDVVGVCVEQPISDISSVVSVSSSEYESDSSGSYLSDQDSSSMERRWRMPRKRSLTASQGWSVMSVDNLSASPSPLAHRRNIAATTVFLETVV